MIPINSTFAPLQVLVDELVRSGMTYAVTCPGSRNAPIALTLAAQEGLTAISVLDERSAGFVALGIAKTSGKPVAITTTSGTAAANLMPAVVEAHEAAVPLIVLTADRPPELREVGAGQAIDQIKLYGSFAKWFVEVGNMPPGRDSAVHHRQLGSRAYNTARLGRPGPVHLNFPLREPLAPRPEPLTAEDWEGRPDAPPWTRASEGLHLGGVDFGAAPERGVIVCGGDAASYAPMAVHLGRSLGWPVLAEPTSGGRWGTDESGATNVIAHYDLLVRNEQFAAERPDLVIRVGQMPTSKPLRAWLHGCRQLVVDPHLDWRDPTRAAEAILAIAPEALQAVPGAEAGGGADDAAGGADDAAGGPDDAAGGATDARGAWLNRWLAADSVVAAELAATEEPFEPLAYNVLADIADTIWVSSSLPIRDFESYFPRTDRYIQILSNRGANGIDGVVSSAAGAAIATGGPVHLVIGELALLHDIGGLFAARRAGADLTVVCANHGGGGIFDYLPVAEHADPELYERHIATPAFPDELSGLVREVRTDRARNVAEQRALVERLARRL